MTCIASNPLLAPSLHFMVDPLVVKKRELNSLDAIHHWCCITWRKTQQISEDCKTGRIHGTGIFTYIHHQNQPHVGKYTSPMDPMGNNMQTILVIFGGTYEFRREPGTSQISNASRCYVTTPASAGASAAVPFVVSAMAGAEVEIDEKSRRLKEYLNHKSYLRTSMGVE